MIRKEEIKKDNFVDAAFKVIRKFKNHCGTREQKKALQASLIKTLTMHGYESFIGTEIGFATRQIGKSFLFDVPKSRHGPLLKKSEENKFELSVQKKSEPEFDT